MAETSIAHSPAASFSLREACENDRWLISEIHCRVFYPTANYLHGVYLRIERAQSVQARLATSGMNGL